MNKREDQQLNFRSNPLPHIQTPDKEKKKFVYRWGSGFATTSYNFGLQNRDFRPESNYLCCCFFLWKVRYFTFNLMLAKKLKGIFWYCNFEKSMPVPIGFIQSHLKWDEWMIRSVWYFHWKRENKKVVWTRAH